jgi:Kef-type K+ transport system membrane component KefB
MTEAFATAALWLALAVLATIMANRFGISMALMEIGVGVAAGFLAERYFAPDSLGANAEWLKFLAATGAVMLTFLAGAELGSSVLRTKWKEVTVVGLVGFFAPFLGCAAIARYALDWSPQASWLAGIALASTSMAVIYSVLIETGFNRHEFGKGLLGSSALNDLSTIVALGLILAPFTYKTVVFLGVSVAVLIFLPFLTKRLTHHYAHRTAAIRTKWILLVLFGLGALALWAGSEAVLPAYIAGMVLAGAAAEDHHWVRRLRTLTVGLLTPFYFIRAGSLVSIPAVISAPLIFLVLFGGKVASKIFGLYPVIGRFRHDRNERWYYTLLMSTGLTFGTISALYGLNHNIVSREQYSFLVAVVIASAVIPTIVANVAFLPKHLLTKITVLDEEESVDREEGAEAAIPEDDGNGRDKK